MSNPLFISDLHLDESRSDVLAAFFDFLQNRALLADALYILGDFFEVWLGDDHESAFNQKIIHALSEMTMPIYIMHGNRDFLLGEVFCEQTGATLLNDPTVIDINGQHVLLMHGDSLCTLDEAYMKARKILRDSAFQKDFLSKSIDERQVFAANLRNQSQAHTRQTADEIMDVTPVEVINIMREYQVTTMIHGHTHRPATHQLDLDGNAATRIVLGDWDKRGWYLTCEAREFKLTSFDISPP